MTIPVKHESPEKASSEGLEEGLMTKKKPLALTNLHMHHWRPATRKDPFNLIQSTEQQHRHTYLGSYSILPNGNQVPYHEVENHGREGRGLTSLGSIMVWNLR